MKSDSPEEILNHAYAEISCTKNIIPCIGNTKLDANFVIQAKLLYGFELDAGNNLIYKGNTGANFSCSMILKSEAKDIQVRLRKNFSEFTSLNYVDGVYTANLLLNKDDSIEIFVSSPAMELLITDFKLSVHI
jgi:hypothetical protein